MTLTIRQHVPAHCQLAADHLLSLQHDDGCWEGEMVWCTMILSQYVIVQHLAGREWEPQVRERIIRHYEVTRTDDGVWGLHPESAGYLFTTALAYVALRLLGVSPDDEMVANARRWLHSQPGGVLAIPTWGKFWLALIGLYGYEGVNPCLPELFAVAELVAASSAEVLLPHALHLPGDRIPVWLALCRRPRPHSRRAAPRALSTTV